jgi:hypothetical protein
MAAYEEFPILRRYEAAKRRKTLVDSLYEDCFRYAIPHRDIYQGVMEGQDKSVTLFDSTAVDSTARFASRMQMSVTPPEYMWAKFTSGTDVPENQKHNVDIMLNVVRERFFQHLGNTNFDAEIPEVYLDLAVGTGAMLIQDFDDGTPCTFTAVPAAQLTIEEGPTGQVWGVYWERRIKYRNLPYTYDTDNLPAELREQVVKKPDDECDVLEASYWDPKAKTYMYEVIARNKGGGGQPCKITDDTFEVWPWVVCRWSKVAGEVYGRGPLVNALADIKTCNKTVELILQNASLAIAGVYTAADDGVLNPNTVEIAPGVVIPVGYNGGVNGRSLDVLPRSGDFDVGQLVLKDLRESIKRKLFDDTHPDTVRSAEEIRQRVKDLADAIGSAWGRIKFELIDGIVKRTTYIMGRKGLIPKLELNGQLIKLSHSSPLADIQNEEELGALGRAIQDMGAIHPMAAGLVFNTPDLMHYVAKKRNVPAYLVRSKEDISASLTQIGQAMGQGAVDPKQMMPK